MASVIGYKKKKSPIGGLKLPEALSTIPMSKKFKKKTVAATAPAPAKKKTVKLSFSQRSKTAPAQSPTKQPTSKLSVVNPKMAGRRTNKRRWAMTICVLFVLLTLGSIGGLTFYTMMSVREVLSAPRRIIQRRSDALALPYTTDNLTKPLKPGDMFIVTGYPIPEQTFHVILLDGSPAKSQNASSSPPPHIWKLSVIDDAGFVMMTDRWNGQWGDEEILLDGRNADLRLRFGVKEYELFYNRRKVGVLDSLGSMGKTIFARIEGQFQLTSARFDHTSYMINKTYDVMNQMKINSTISVSGQFVAPCSEFRIILSDVQGQEIFRLVASLKTKQFSVPNQNYYETDKISKFNIRLNELFDIHIINRQPNYVIRVNDNYIATVAQTVEVKRAAHMSVISDGKSIDLHWIRLVH